MTLRLSGATASTKMPMRSIVSCLQAAPLAHSCLLLLSHRRAGERVVTGFALLSGLQGALPDVVLRQVSALSQQLARAALESPAASP
jgi:hypothetical protein